MQKLTSDKFNKVFNYDALRNIIFEQKRKFIKEENDKLFEIFTPFYISNADLFL